MTATQIPALTATLPMETDAKLAALHGQAHQLQTRMASDINRLRTEVLADKKVWQGRRQVFWDLRTDAEVIELATEKAPTHRTLAAYAKAAEDLAVIEDQMAALNAIFAAYRWSRFFMVTSSDGHIHESMSCSTTYPTTTWGWHPELSGLTEADAVAQLGPLLCTVCFPSAPVAWKRSAAEVKAEAEKRAGTYCTAEPYDFSDRYQRNAWATGYATCNGCGHRAALTSTGKMRKHKPAKGKK